MTTMFTAAAFLAFEHHVWGWVVTNFTMPFLCPFVLVLLIALAFKGKTALLKAVWDFQLCLYSTPLVGAAIYDLLQKETRGASSLGWLVTLLLVSAALSAISVSASQSEEVKEHVNTVDIVVVSASVVGAAIILVLTIRAKEVMW